MKLAVAWGLLVPLLGTSLGAACVFFLKKGLGGPGAAGAHRLRLRRHGGRIHLEPADPCYGAVHRCGDLVLFAGCNRLLGRYPLPVGARSPDLPSPPAEPAGRGTPHPAGALHYDGAGGHPPQHPRGDGGGGGLRGFPGGRGTDHDDSCTDPVPGHRHPELPRGGHHLHAPALRGGGQGPGLCGGACSPARWSPWARY